MTNKAEFVNAKDFMERNPDSAFTKVIKAGVELWYKTENTVGERYIEIRAIASSKKIGYADFEEDDNTIDLQNIKVEDASKRCGVGKAMCILAVKLLQKPARNIWDKSETTEEFLSFWKHLKCKYSNQFV